MLPTPCDGTDDITSATFAFYGWKLDMYGWLRILMKVQSICAASTAMMMHISRDSASLFFNIMMHQKRKAFVEAMGEADCQKHSTPLCKISSRRYSWGLFTEKTSASDRCSPFRSTATDPRKLNAGHTDSGAFYFPTLTDTAAPASRGLLRELVLAEKYLKSIYSIYVINESSSTSNSRQFSCPWVAPKKKSARCIDQTPYTQCLWSMLMATLTNTPSASIRNILYFHELAKGEIADNQHPRLVNRMYSLAASSPPPDWRSLKLASDIHLSQVSSLHLSQI